jgi:hypothetical protein
MRPHNDPQVREIAARLAEGKGVLDWPATIPEDGACAILIVTRTAEAYLAYAPSHPCNDLDYLRSVAARTILDFIDRGEPDERWRPFDNGTGWVTSLPAPEEAICRL